MIDSFISKKNLWDILHSSAHPSVVVDGVSLEGFLPDHFGHHPELGLFLVGFQEFRRSIGFFQIGLPRTRISPVDPSLGDALQIIGLLVLFLVPQPVGSRIRVVQDHKGGLVAFAKRRLEAVPGFFSTGVDDNAGVGLAPLRVGGVSGVGPVGRLDGAELGDSSLVLNIGVVDGIGRKHTHFLSSQQSAPDGSRDLLGPVNVGIRELLPGNITSWLVSALDGKILGDDRLAEFLVEWGSGNAMKCDFLFWCWRVCCLLCQIWTVNSANCCHFSVSNEFHWYEMCRVYSIPYRAMPFMSIELSMA